MCHVACGLCVGLFCAVPHECICMPSLHFPKGFANIPHSGTVTMYNLLLGKATTKGEATITYGRPLHCIKEPLFDDQPSVQKRVRSLMNGAIE